MGHNVDRAGGYRNQKILKNRNRLHWYSVAAIHAVHFLQTKMEEQVARKNSSKANPGFGPDSGNHRSRESLEKISVYFIYHFPFPIRMFFFFYTPQQIQLLFLSFIALFVFSFFFLLFSYRKRRKYYDVANLIKIGRGTFRCEK